MTGHCIKDKSKTNFLMEKGDLHILMEIFIKERGQMESAKEKEYFIKKKKSWFTKEIGPMKRNMARE